MNYVKIKFPDVANGPGVRVSLFVSGCYRHCPGCFNPETWDTRAGQLYTRETEKELLRHLAKPEVAGLSILGGEPFLLVNLPTVWDLVLTAKEHHYDKPIWIWTGYTFEELLALGRSRVMKPWREAQRVRDILNLADVLVDGPYIEAQRDLKLQFRGSANQRIIDLPRSMREGAVALWEGRA